ncbi:MAG: clostripain-related cysteine peptidase [Prevotella sp.]
MKYLLTVLCGLFLLASCKDDNDDPVEELLDRTVILYVTGDNNLSADAKDNITSLAAGSIGIDNGKIVILVDNYETKPTKLVISNGKVELQEEFDNEFYMTSPSMMQLLLTSVMDEYKSKSYGLVIWGHSTGWLVEKDTIPYNQVKTRGYGYDDNGGGTSKTAIWINYTTMAKVLESLPSNFDFIVGDCCLLQCAEVAYELRNCTDYLIGSPAETPNDGIPYKEIVPYMFDSSVDSYMKIAEAITDNTIVNNGISYNPPSSVIRTAGMENLAAATKKVISQGQLPYPINDSQAVYYYIYGGIKIMYDMQSIFKNNVPAEAYTEWKNALDAAVIYRKGSSRWATSYGWLNDFTVTDENYGGMSMFFPMDKYNKMTTYLPNERISEMQWYKAAGIDQYAR